MGTILRSLFGDRLGVSTSVEQQWAIGRKPLATQRTQFHTRIDADTRSGALSTGNGTRMKAEYDRLVALETRYGADGRFTTREREELADGYGDLTQALTEGGYASNGGSSGGGSSGGGWQGSGSSGGGSSGGGWQGSGSSGGGSSGGGWSGSGSSGGGWSGGGASGGGSTTLSVAAGRTDFERRVDSRLSARRITRATATSLKRDYAALIQTEASYARDGLSDREQDDLEARLDALDARVGDTAYGNTAVIDDRTRLANIERALSGSGLGTTAQAQLRVELGDLTRLEAAYSRATPGSDDKSYLERRIVDLETRARVRR